MKLLGLAAAGFVALGFGIAAAVGAFGGSSHPHTVTAVAPPSPSPAELAAIRQLALRAAAGMGDPSPTDGVLVPTTRRLAELVDVDTIEPDVPVYFVVVHGEFKADSAPPGVEPPTGTILTLTIDPATNESLDTGLVKAMPDVNAIGEPEPLQLVSTSRRAGEGPEIEAARASDPGLFAIFPRLPGERRCVIPAGGTWMDHRLHGTCQTRVWYPNTHGHGEARVVFRESWGAGRFSSWTMWEELPTTKVLVTKLHGEPAPQLRYAVAGPVDADIELTKHVPCLDGHQRLVGPNALRRFHAVTAVSCTDGLRTNPGEGQWEVLIRRVAVSGVGGLQRYFEQPDQPDLPKNVACVTALVGMLVPVFVDARGDWLAPRTPVDGCGFPSGSVSGQVAPDVRWRVVSTHRIKRLVSAPALASNCPMRWKNAMAGTGWPHDRQGGRLFAVAPKTVHVCVFRTQRHAFTVGSFVRGFALDASKTRRLLAALTRPAPSGSCPHERTYAVVIVTPGSAASVELGGCFRVGRPYPFRTGGADPAVVRAILGAR
jgi:hypothetical protein